MISPNFHGEAIENEHLRVDFQGGMLARITDKVNNISTRAEQDWFWYNASVGDNLSSQTSGAYVFRPARNQAWPVFTGLPFMRVYQGPLADEVRRHFEYF